ASEVRARASEVVAWNAQAPDDLTGGAMISPAQPDDKDELTRLYRRNHPGLGRWFEPEATLESRTFVAKDVRGRVIGLALVSCISYGVHLHATIHELEIASGVRSIVGRS